MSRNDKREWRKVMRSMPREVREAIDAYNEPDAQISVAKARVGTPDFGWWLVQLFPSTRAVLFRCDDPQSPVIWGEFVPGPEWVLSRVENDQHELVGGRLHDLGGRLVHELTVEEYHRDYRKLEVSRVVLSWAEHEKPAQADYLAVLKCLDQSVVPTMMHLDALLAAVRSGKVTPISMRQ